MPRVVRRCLLTTACAAAGVLGSTPVAHAGEFIVANCNSDVFHSRTDAFEPHVARGMKIRYACGPGRTAPRGIVLANVVGRQRVARGALSEIVMIAPPGTEFSQFVWSGEARRSDSAT